MGSGPHQAGLAALDGGSTLDLLGKREHLLAELGEAIAGDVPFHQLASKPTLKLGDAPLHGRLAGIQCFRCCQGAAVACNCQEILDVVPLEHGRNYALLL